MMRHARLSSARTDTILPQWVPGLESFDSVVGYGLIELLLVSEMLDGLALLRGTPHWTEKDHKRLMGWMKEMLDWLMDSRLGHLEKSRTNNHGVWFHQTALAIALHANRRAVSECDALPCH
jgi:hypothetical protein